MYLIALAIVTVTPEHARTAPVVEDKLICRYEEGPDTGSHISRRTRLCLHASEWRAQQAITENSLRRMEELRGMPKPVEGSLSGNPQ